MGDAIKRRPDFDAWPDLRVVLRPLPWTWRLKPHVYVDDHGALSTLTVQWLCLTVEWWGQDPGQPLFPFDEVDSDG